MRPREPTGAVLSSIALAIVLASPSFAHADEPSAGECIAAHEKALDLSKRAKLHEARSAFVSCASASCPSDVRNECADRLSRLVRALPKIVFAAEDAKGNDLSSVHVTMDGVPLRDKLDGRAIDVDPGEHTFRFEAPGLSVVEKKLIVREGETDRRERIVLGPAEADVPTKPVPPPATEATSGGATQRAIALVIGGVGLVGIGVGAYFGLRASSKWDDAKTECGNGCGPDAPAQGERDDAKGAATISTIVFAASGVALATGVVLFLTAPKGSSARARSAIAVNPTLDASQAGVTLRGAFR